MQTLLFLIRQTVPVFEESSSSGILQQRGFLLCVTIPYVGDPQQIINRHSEMSGHGDQGTEIRLAALLFITENCRFAEIQYFPQLFLGNTLLLAKQLQAICKIHGFLHLIHGIYRLYI